MKATKLKTTNLLVENTLPNTSETEELENSDGVIKILVGKPTQTMTAVGNAPKIQLRNKFGKVDDIGTYVLSEVAKMPEGIRTMAMVSLKVDKTVGMGIVGDIKNELRKVNMLKVNYTTVEGDVFQSL